MRVVYIGESRTQKHIQKLAMHDNLSLQLLNNKSLEFRFILFTIYYIIYIIFRKI